MRPGGLMLDPVFHQGFAHLAPLGLSFDAWLFYHQLPDLIPLLETLPETSVVLNHRGGPLGTEPHVDRARVFADWHSGIQRLARFPNVAVMLGGFGMLYLGRGFHLCPEPPLSEELANTWRPYVDVCIETFGVGRSMFESNFPIDKQSCGYGVPWNAFKRIAADRTADEKAALFHDNAVRSCRLPRPFVGTARHDDRDRIDA